MKKLNSFIVLTFLSILAFGQISEKEQILLADNQGNHELVAKPLNSSQAKSQNSGVDPVKFLSGNIAVKIISESYSPEIKEYTSKESKEILLIGNITCQTLPFRLQQLINNPKSRLDCDPDTHCGVVFGGSDFKVTDPYDYSKILFQNRYPVYVREIRERIELKDVKGESKLVTTYMSSLEDTTLLEGLTLEIKPYVAAEVQLPRLSPHYVIWLMGGKYLEHLSKPSYGSGSAMQWDYNFSKLVPVQGKLNVGIPYVISEPYGNMDIYQTYDPLLIGNYKEFEKFLLNPTGTFTIEASGSRVIKDDSFTSQVHISLTINLSPYLEVAPLEPLGLPEIGPLDPVGIAPLDPVGIAPLDPVKGSPEPTVKPEGEFELAPLEPVRK